jgi:membrane protease YdiL (CAAX protease family)
MGKTLGALGLILLAPGLLVAVSLAFAIASKGPPSHSVVPWILLFTELLLAAVAVTMVGRFGYTPADLGIGRIQPRFVVYGVVAGVAFAGLFELGVQPLLDWFRSIHGNAADLADTRRVLGSARVPFVVANVALAPFVEELTYRGLFERRLSAAWSSRAALLWGALGFGLWHWPGGPLFVLATCGLGALLLSLRRRTGSLWTVFAAHWVFNALEVAVALAR